MDLRLVRGFLGSDMEVETVTTPETIVQEFVVGPIIAALRCGGPGATMFKDSEQTGLPGTACWSVWNDMHQNTVRAFFTW